MEQENADFRKPTEAEYDRAASAAARMLSRRPLSEAALLDKLREKEFSEESAQYAAERMRCLGALDDVAFAQRIVRSYAAKGCGKLRIRQELEKRGIPRELAREVLEEFEPDWDAMTALLHKRLCGDIGDRARNEKAFAALQRRGFSFQQIRQAMERYCRWLEDEEEKC